MLKLTKVTLPAKVLGFVSNTIIRPTKFWLQLDFFSMSPVEERSEWIGIAKKINRTNLMEVTRTEKAADGGSANQDGGGVGRDGDDTEWDRGGAN
ncbi:hypothetical protein RDI58_017768 [Solanum bulbocastanum]|uniref:Uncharacterized protein n=1 Tax=Solanum bulbocastanum TaxID=147425 RepID=A0AAN8TGP1_SOLBU